MNLEQTNDEHHLNQDQGPPNHQQQNQGLHGYQNQNQGARENQDQVQYNKTDEQFQQNNAAYSNSNQQFVQNSPQNQNYEYQQQNNPYPSNQQQNYGTQNNQEIHLNFYQEAPQNDPSYNQQPPRDQNQSPDIVDIENSPGINTDQNTNTINPAVFKRLESRERTFDTKNHILVFRCNGEEIGLLDRMPFVRKVLALVMIQLLITIFACALSYAVPDFQKFQIKYWYIAIISTVGLILVQIFLIWKPLLAREVPRNYILLFMFSIFVSYDVSFLCSCIFYRKGQQGAQYVLICAVMCIGYTVGLIVHAFRARDDYVDKSFAYGWMFLGSLIAFGILSICFPTVILQIFYCYIVCWLFGIYLNWDIQSIMTDKNHKFSVDDYIVAALLIYLDIIILFLDMILGDRNRTNNI